MKLTTEIVNKEVYAEIVNTRNESFWEIYIEKCSLIVAWVELNIPVCKQVSLSQCMLWIAL